jgi:hypothetical protein
LTRQRVTAAVGFLKAAASASLHQRRRTMPMTPDPSAASCRRRDVVIESAATAATTAPRGLSDHVASGLACVETPQLSMMTRTSAWLNPLR